MTEIIRKGNYNYILVGVNLTDNVNEDLGEVNVPVRRTLEEQEKARRKFIEFVRDCTSFPIKSECKNVLPELYKTDDFVRAANAGLNDKAKYR